MITITTAENKEKKGIRESLIKSYEILEEKFNQNEEKINEFKTELLREDQKKKKEKVRAFGLGQDQTSILKE